MSPPPTFYTAVPPPAAPPAATAVTEIELVPYYVTVLDTEIIPPKVGDLPQHPRSRAATPMSRAPTPFHLSTTTGHASPPDSGDSISQYIRARTPHSSASGEDSEEEQDQLASPHPSPRASSPLTPLPVDEEPRFGPGPSTLHLHTSSNSEMFKVPEPLGGPGRPNSGGYNLEEATGWNSAKMKELKVRRPLILHLCHTKPTSLTQDVAALCISAHLDEDKCYSHQDPAKVDSAVSDVSLNPSAPHYFLTSSLQGTIIIRDLQKYANSWPLRAAITSRLKYTSSKSRKEKRLVQGIHGVANSAITELAKLKANASSVHVTRSSARFSVSPWCTEFVSSSFTDAHPLRLQSKE